MLVLISLGSKDKKNNDYGIDLFFHRIRRLCHFSRDMGLLGLLQRNQKAVGLWEQ